MEGINRVNIKLVLGITTLSLTLSAFSTVSMTAKKYLLCGPDEDGCYPDIYTYCNCIPYNEQQGNQAYCLDFDAMKCYPLSQKPDCYPLLIRKDQASCLATIFQSHAAPGCDFTTDDFCNEHQMRFCDAEGHPGSCHKV